MKIGVSAASFLMDSACYGNTVSSPWFCRLCHVGNALLFRIPILDSRTSDRRHPASSLM